MAIGEKGSAAQATMALLKLAKEIADGVVGDADPPMVRAVFDRLCLETDARAEAEPARLAPRTLH